ncbi:polyketide synthase, partial [Streptomyces sp. NPDC050211]|uniref:beta-ketoacyl [acyl carrier protein] synthase domain-containing protein n=1 Tax=Streptomyces sp. NPDC050211 TaxID=3154932 RepID=UPI00343153DB
MDEREILTRFKAGTLGRSEAARLLTGRAQQTPPATAEPAPAPMPDPQPPQREPAPVREPAPQPPPEREPVPAPVREAADTGVPVGEGCAVVGLAGRYPMAPDPQTFWENLREGRDTSSEGPAGRPGPSPLEPGQRGHFLDAAADFDAAFFALTAAEGALMDPQERLFLETAWQALEDAGCAGSRLDALRGPDGRPRAVGVFVGVSSSDYALLAAESWAAHGPREMPGPGHAGLPGRLAALLGLSGPGQIVDTGVCSALTAVHLAVQSLRRGECAAALAGGVELLLHPSRARDGAAEGVGAVVLKRLDRALADGDRVHAVVRDTSSGFRQYSAGPAPGRPGQGSAARGAPVPGPGQTGEAARPRGAGGG